MPGCVLSQKTDERCRWVFFRHRVPSLVPLSLPGNDPSDFGERVHPQIVRLQDPQEEGLEVRLESAHQRDVLLC